MTMKDFAEILLATGGDLSRLSESYVGEIMKKAQKIKESAERQADQRRQQRKFFAAQRHDKIMSEIRYLVGNYVAFTPSQIQLAEINTGNVPRSYQFYSAHLLAELDNPNGTIERVSGPLTYRTAKGEEKTRKVSGNKSFYRFVD